MLLPIAYNFECLMLSYPKTKIKQNKNNLHKMSLLIDVAEYINADCIQYPQSYTNREAEGKTNSEFVRLGVKVEHLHFRMSATVGVCCCALFSCR